MSLKLVTVLISIIGLVVKKIYPAPINTVNH